MCKIIKFVHHLPQQVNFSRAARAILRSGVHPTVDERVQHMQPAPSDGQVCIQQWMSGYSTCIPRHLTVRCASNRG